MKYLKTVASHLALACIYFTVAQMVITGVFQLTAQNGSKGQFLIFEVEIILFVFSVAMAVIQDVFRIGKLSFGVRLLIHFLLSMLAVFLLFLSVTKQITNARSMVLIMVAAAVIYALFAAVFITVRAVKAKNSSRKEYRPMFEKSKKQ